MDEIKEKLPEFDENAEYIDINALYANTSFIICINKDLASAYFNREKMIKKIINLQMDVGRTCRKVQAPIREKNFDVALAHAIDVSFIKCHVRSEYLWRLFFLCFYWQYFQILHLFQSLLILLSCQHLPPPPPPPPPPPQLPNIIFNSIL